MTEKSPPAGWVVQVTTPGEPSLTQTRSSQLSALRGAPSFEYFNVASVIAGKAEEATTVHLAEDTAREARAVRALTSKEITSLNLKPGEVVPA
jgi:hypothetical protein